MNFIPLTQSARTVKDVDLTALSVRLNFLYHLLYPQNVFFLRINTFLARPEGRLLNVVLVSWICDNQDCCLIQP